MERGAYLSNDRRYRYVLYRRWAPGPFCMFVGLNPSTADETTDDPTIRRCVGFAQAWGFGALFMANLFAYRATLPSVMKEAIDPVGPANDVWLRELSKGAGVVVAAWGAHGTHRNRDACVRDMLPCLHYLRLTKGGHPSHPLYLPKHLKPVRFAAPGARCKPCRDTGAVHCSDPARCGGPWSDAVLPCDATTRGA